MIVAWGSGTGLLLDFRGTNVVNMATILYKHGNFTIDPDNTQGGIYTYTILANRAAALSKLPFIVTALNNVSDLLDTLPVPTCIDKAPSK